MRASVWRGSMGSHDIVDQGDPDAASFVRITNRQIYDSLIQLERTVSGMDNRMNNVLGENRELRTRVRSLELKTYTIMAGLVSALGVAGVIVAKGGF